MYFRILIKKCGKKCSCFSTRTQELRISMKLRMLKNSRLERITQNTKVRGNTSPNLPLAGECPLVLGRYDVLFSTASRPFRLSALQNACVYRHLGHILSFCFVVHAFLLFYKNLFISFYIFMLIVVKFVFTVV